MGKRSKRSAVIAHSRPHVESKGWAAVDEAGAANPPRLDWSARVSLVSCLVSVVFGLTTVWQTVRHENREVAVAEAAAKSVAVLHRADFSLVNEYVFQTQLMFSSALHQSSFAEAVSSGAFYKALSVVDAPNMEISREEMDIIGKAFPDVEATVALCKTALAGVNQSKADGYSLVHAGPTVDDPDNSTAQVYLHYEIEMLPRVAEICGRAAASLNAIAAPGETSKSQADIVWRQLIAEMQRGEKFKLLDRPNGRYRFGPVLEKMARGESVDDVLSK